MGHGTIYWILEVIRLILFVSLFVCFHLILCFVIGGDCDAKHEEWIGSNIIDQHGRSAWDFCNAADCLQVMGNPLTYLAINLILFLLMFLLLLKPNFVIIWGHQITVPLEWTLMSISISQMPP